MSMFYAKLKYQKTKQFVNSNDMFLTKQFINSKNTKYFLTCKQPCNINFLQ